MRDDVMRRSVIGAMLAVAIPVAARAQDTPTPPNALDRVDPVQTDRQRRADEAVRPPADPAPPIAIDPAVAIVDRAPGAPAVTVGAILFAGLEALSPQDFADIAAANVGRSLDRTALAALASQVAARARNRGYVFASAAIAPQRLNAGVLTVRIDEGRIDAVRTSGDVDPAVDRALAALVDGRPVTLDALERRLLIAGDLSGVRVDGARYVREGEARVLLVRVTADRVRARATLENDGSRPIGPEQLRLDLDVAAVLFDDDSLALTYVATPFEPGELNYGRVRYAKRISDAGTELGLVASYSATDPGAYLADRDIEGRSWFAGASVLQPLWRRRDASLWFEGEFGVRTLRQFRDGVLARHDRVTVIRAGMYGHADWAGGRLRANLSLARGLDAFGASGRGDPRTSRADAAVDFTTLTGWADWIRPLGSDVSLRVAARSQLSSEPLLISEEIGIGGGAFLRGYNYNERSGDQGAMAMGELRWDWRRPLGGLVQRTQLYAFADGGRVTNLNGGRGSGSLASGGGGMRTQVTRGLSADVEVAVPFSGERYDTGDADPRVNFRVAKTF